MGVPDCLVRVLEGPKYLMRELKSTSLLSISFILSAHIHPSMHTYTNTQTHEYIRFTISVREYHPQLRSDKSKRRTLLCRHHSETTASRRCAPRRSLRNSQLRTCSPVRICLIDNGRRGQEGRAAPSARQNQHYNPHGPCVYYPALNGCTRKSAKNFWGQLQIPSCQ
jgi:hypothetical protein